MCVGMCDCVVCDLYKRCVCVMGVCRAHCVFVYSCISAQTHLSMGPGHPALTFPQILPHKAVAVSAQRSLKTGFLLS